MDDMDTRLEAERPEVADALRSMNWEERLEEARARRKAVLARNEAADKRPVVRIVDASVMARRLAEGVEPPVAAKAPSPPPAPVEDAVVEEVSPAPAAPAAPRAATPPDETPRKEFAARTAMGFGLGLGLGTSVLLGFYLFASPGPRSVPAPEAGVASAAVATPPAPAPETAAPVSVPAPRETAAIAPAMTAAPAVPVAAAPPGEDAFPLPSEASAPPGRSTPSALPGATPAETFGRPAPLPGPKLAALPGRLPLPPAEMAPVLLPAPAPGLPMARLAPGRVDPRAAESGPGGGESAAPVHPAIAQAAVSLPPPGIGSALDSDPALVPRDLARVQHVAFPAPRGDAPAPDPSPSASFAPPAPPPPEVATAEPDIPGAAALFVRLAVPQTVPEAEAEELAGVLRDLGVGDSRVTRVGFKVSETHVRYFSDADAPAAEALARMIGTEARDHTSFRPRPPDGTLEIFLAGERTAPPPRAAAASNRARAQPPDEMTRLRNRIVDRLRRGEHL